MEFPGRVEPLTGALPPVSFRWDPETEILASRFESSEGGRGFSGSIELEDGQGAVLTVDVERGVACALEIVVWPESTIIPDLTPPRTERQGRLVIPARPSQPGVGVVEIDVAITAERRPDDSVIHVRVGPRVETEAVRLANDLIAETGPDGELAGFWLLNVPPFPEAAGHP